MISDLEPLSGDMLGRIEAMDDSDSDSQLRADTA